MLAQPENIPAINTVLQEMIEEGSDLLDREKIPAAQRSFSASVDARYERQNYEINIPLREPAGTEEILGEAIRQFHAAHEKNFGYSNEAFHVQLVNFRLSAVGEVEKPALVCKPLEPDAALPAPQEIRQVLFVGEKDYISTPVYHRDGFVPGLQAEGPMIIEQMDCTTVIPPHWSIFTDGYLNLHVNYKGGEEQ